MFRGEEMRTMAVLLLVTFALGCGKEGSQPVASQQPPAPVESSQEVRKQYEEYLNKNDELGSLINKRGYAFASDYLKKAQADKDMPDWEGSYPPSEQTTRINELADKLSNQYRDMKNKWISLGIDPVSPKVHDPYAAKIFEFQSQKRLFGTLSGYDIKKPDADLDKKQEITSFDTKNAEKGLAFAFAGFRPLGPGNALAEKESRVKAWERRTSVRGMKIDWVVYIQRIDENGRVELSASKTGREIFQEPQLCHIKIPENEPIDSVKSLSLVPDWLQKTEPKSGETARFVAGRDFLVSNASKDQLAKISKGTKARITGTVLLAIDLVDHRLVRFDAEKGSLGASDYSPGIFIHNPTVTLMD